MGHTQPDAGRRSDGHIFIYASKFAEALQEALSKSTGASTSVKAVLLGDQGYSPEGDWPSLDQLLQGPATSDTAADGRKDCAQAFGQPYGAEADPSGLRPSDPGAKLDAGKINMWLMVEGFAPALAVIESYLESEGFQQDAPQEEAYLHPAPTIAVATRTLRRWPAALREVARVTNAGAKKYSPGGWKSVENGSERYLGALLRHVSKIDEGIDQDTGCFHLAQVVWNALASACLSEDRQTCNAALQLAIHYLDDLQHMLDSLPEVDLAGV